MRLINGFAHFLGGVLLPLLSPADAGSGGGAAASASAGGDAGAGAAGSGGGGAAPFVLNDDALVDLGGGRTGKWGELRDSTYMPRDKYDQGVTYLNRVATQLDSREQQLLQRVTAASRGTNANGGALPETDPFAELEGMPIVDGKTLAQLARKMNTEGFGKLGTTLAALATKLANIERQTGGLAQATGRTAERDAETQFTSFIQESLGAIGTVKGLPEGVSLDKSSPFLAELANDLYRSYDPGSWRNAAEFHKMLGDRISQAIAFVRTLDKAAITAGEEKRKQFFKTGGAARPSGQSRYKHQSGAELAAMLHRPAQAT